MPSIGTEQIDVVFACLAFPNAKEHPIAVRRPYEGTLEIPRKDPQPSGRTRKHLEIRPVEIHCDDLVVLVPCDPVRNRRNHRSVAITELRNNVLLRQLYSDHHRKIAVNVRLFSWHVAPEICEQLAP